MQIYHELLALALNEAILYFTQKDVDFDSEELVKPFEFDGIPYGQTKESHAAIRTIKGKSTKKWAHVSIYRMDSGRYELTCYIL